jgi:cyclohexa-1,5-dienecarbonyl-CoA hydratase
MTELKNLKFTNVDGIASITLARPKHNVLNIEMMDELNALLDDLINQSDLKCVVIRGEGKSWCAGVEVGDHKPHMVDQMVKVFDGIFERFSRLEVPTIAAVHGACLGGGMELAIACDIVIAAESVKLGQPEIKLGFFPPYAVVRLPELVGPAKAIEICASGKIYTAKEAQSMGFVGHVTEDALFEDAVNRMIEEFKYNSPLIIRMNKRAVRMVQHMGFKEASQTSNDYFLNTLMKTDDTLEGIRSFEEKRKPVWTNK